MPMPGKSHRKMLAKAQAFGAQCAYTPDTCSGWTVEQRKQINALSPAQKAVLKEYLANTYLASLESSYDQQRKAIWDTYAQKTPTVPTPTAQAMALDILLQGLSHVGNRNSGGYTSDGQTVYSADECIGPVIMGECHGSILPKSAYHPTCYGTMLNGQCTGPMF